MRNSLKITLISILLAACCSACSFRSLILSHLDTVLYWKVSDDFDLNSKQDLEVQDRLSGAWKRFRCKDIGSFITDIKKLEEVLGRALVQADMEWIRQRLVFWRIRIFGPLMEEVFPLMESLSEAQWKHFVTSSLEQLEERFELVAMPEAKFREKWLENRVERLEDYYGPLAPRQINIVEKELSGISQAHYRKWLEQREIGLNFFVSHMSIKIPRGTRKEHLLDFIKNPEKMRPKVYQKSYLQNKDVWYQQFVTIHNIMNHEQRKHLQKMVKEIKIDLYELELSSAECQGKSPIKIPEK